LYAKENLPENNQEMSNTLKPKILKTAQAWAIKENPKSL
jgi:hypothetical protein